MNAYLFHHNTKKKVFIGSEHSGEKRGDETSSGGVFDENDKRIFNRYVKEFLKNKAEWKFTAPDEFNPSMRGLLCTKRDEVHDRIVTFLTTVNITSGLLFTAIVGAALNPFVIDRLDPDKKIYGQIFNITAALSCMCEFSIAFYTCQLLLCTISQHTTPAMTYRGILQMGTCYTAVENFFFFPIFGIGIMFMMSQLINGDFYTGIIGSVVVAIVFCYVYYLATAFPFGMEHAELNIAPQQMPWIYYTKKNIFKGAEKQYAVMLAEAQKSLFEIIEDDEKFMHAGAEDSGAEFRSAGENEAKDKREMIDLISAALPELNAEALNPRKSALATSLLRSGLSVQRLKAAATIVNGAQLVDGKLSAHPELTQGQALALTTFIIGGNVDG